MVTHIHTIAFNGLDITPVEVQVQISAGLPAFAVVGLPDKAVAESRERVRSAILSLGLSMPAKRITVNLAPADISKEGSHYDLPIALGILCAMEVIPADALQQSIVLGELSLDGRLMPVSGVLPAAVHALGTGNNIICPHICGAEAAWAGDVEVLAPPSLLALINHVKGQQLLSPPKAQPAKPAEHMNDLAQVRGQLAARRALEVAAAGGHNLLMSGPPGTGKSLLASCLPGILPAMSGREILEVSMIQSIGGLIREGRLSDMRPYRAPHHSISLVAMVGGGQKVKPGEITLAHHGVLFLDELPEFPRAALEALRQPLETGNVTVARANSHITYPARFQLIAAMNPCRCGHLGDPALACRKAPLCGQDYQNRLSGPLLDRIDMTIDMPALDTLSMLKEEPGEPSSIVAARVQAARDIQTTRYKALDMAQATNASINAVHLQEHITLDTDATALMEKAVERLRLSMRAYTRILRVARTIADLDTSANIAPIHLAEAIGYRHAKESFLQSAA